MKDMRRWPVSCFQVSGGEFIRNLVATEAASSLSRFRDWDEDELTLVPRVRSGDRYHQGPL